MICERCSTDGAHFVGSSRSYGPAESDAENTPANLPGGYGWLCDNCLSSIDAAVDRQLAGYHVPAPNPTINVMSCFLTVYDLCPSFDDYIGEVVNNMNDDIDNWLPEERAAVDVINDLGTIPDGIAPDQWPAIVERVVYNHYHPYGR